MKIEDLILEMQEVKAAHPSLELSDILSMFNILAVNNLTTKIEHLRRAIKDGR